jgi:hypothetical protein
MVFWGVLRAQGEDSTAICVTQEMRGGSDIVLRMFSPFLVDEEVGKANFHILQ